MIVSIIGCKNFNNYDFFKREMNSLLKNFNVELLISDNNTYKMCERFSLDRNIPCKIVDNNDKEIIYGSDYVLVFWNGISTDTKKSIDLSIQRGVYIRIIYYNNI